MRFGMRSSLFPLGRHDDWADHIREAELLAREIDDNARLANCYNYLLSHHWSVASAPGHSTLWQKFSPKMTQNRSSRQRTHLAKLKNWRTDLKCARYWRIAAGDSEKSTLEVEKLKNAVPELPLSSSFDRARILATSPIRRFFLGVPPCLSADHQPPVER